MKSILEHNHEDRNNLHERCDKISKTVEDQNGKISDRINQNYKDLHDFVSTVNNEMQAANRQTSITLKEMKSSAEEIANDRHNRLKELFDREMADVKARYN